MPMFWIKQQQKKLKKILLLEIKLVVTQSFTDLTGIIIRLI